MIYALVLSGGKGIRLGNNIPKQYLKVGDKPIIGYSLEIFQKHPQIDGIVIVADDSWQAYIKEFIDSSSINKFCFFAPSGISRTHSILNGLNVMKDNGIEDNSIVIIHDAARPNVNEDIIDGCIRELDKCDCAMPVIPIKDTVYLSEDGRSITSLLNRNYLCAGQAPESVRLGQYRELICSLSDEELSSISGTSAIVYKNGLKVNLFSGDEKNYKITTISDLEKFRQEIEK